MSLVAHLLYVQYGGDGIQLSYPIIMDMELSEILWWGRKLNQLREEESKRLKAASPKS